MCLLAMPHDVRDTCDSADADAGDAIPLEALENHLLSDFHMSTALHALR